MKYKHEICPMQILLLSATANEIELFTKNGSPVDLLIAGVGVPATLYHLQKRMQQIDYDLVIQAGIAGTFNTNIALGETVWVQQDCFGDLGTEEKGRFAPLFESGLADKNEFPFTDGWLTNSGKITNQVTLRGVRAVTVNTITDSPLQQQQLVEHFQPDIESMEGAALHYVCLQEKVPFIQLRAISNYVGERDKSKWKMQEAITNLHNELLKLLNQQIRR